MISSQVKVMYGGILKGRLAMGTWITNPAQTIGPHATLNNLQGRTKAVSRN